MRSEEFITEMPSINPSLDLIMTKLDDIVDKYSGKTSEYSQYTFLITTDTYDIGDNI